MFSKTRAHCQIHQNAHKIKEHAKTRWETAKNALEPTNRGAKERSKQQEMHAREARERPFEGILHGRILNEIAREAREKGFGMYL